MVILYNKKEKSVSKTTRYQSHFSTENAMVQLHQYIHTAVHHQTSNLPFNSCWRTFYIRHRELLSKTTHLSIVILFFCVPEIMPVRFVFVDFFFFLFVEFYFSSTPYKQLIYRIILTPVANAWSDKRS